MRILNRLFGSGGKANNERPPKPESEDIERTKKGAVCEVAVEYHNGDVETVECYGIRRGEDVFTLLTEPYPSKSDGEVYVRYKRETINYETLAREPIVERVGTETHRVTFTREHEWKYGGMGEVGMKKKWRPVAKEAEVTAEDREVSGGD